VAELLAILASLCFAANHTIVRRALAIGANPGTCVIVNVGTNLVLVWILFLWKHSIAEFWTPWIGLFAVAGILAPGLFRSMMFHGFQHLGVSRTSAVVAASPMVSTLLAIAFLDERLTLMVGLGTSAIVGGLLLLTYGKDPQDVWDKRYLIFPFVAILCGGVRDVVVRSGLQHVGGTLVGAAFALLSGMTFILLTAYVRRKQEPFIWDRKPLILTFLAGFFTCGSYLAMYESYRRGLIVRVAPLSYTSPMFIIIISMLFLRDIEIVTRKTILAVVCVVVGVVFIALRQ
jgi:drug/metabolite transporter (DMT)-like permease